MVSYVSHELIGGYYRKDYTVYVNRKLALMPYAQAGILENKEGIHLISYSTLVCTIDKDGYLSCTGTYSNTTRKHINRFLKEVAPSVDYYDAKYCCEHGVKMHVQTKKLKELTA